MKDKWETLKYIFSIQERVNKLFDDIMTGGQGSGHDCSVSWSPRVDIYDTDQEFIVNAELPGIHQDDIEIKVEGDLLIIGGCRPLASDTSNEEVRKYHMIENSYGSFRRTFKLPESVDQPGVNAVLQDGILRITLPRRNKPEIKHIPIE
ncbi:MAG TPA: Hsp20/alpha crystallin family protein [Nitrospirae bacterium]|nr:Hsp20/alpha crystallin family protein [Nitrospirota bacterium]